MTSSGVLRIASLECGRAGKQVFTNYHACWSNRRTCLSAPNGAGKSTLLCAIAGLLPLHGGQIVWHERPIQMADPSIALSSDSIQLPAFLTAAELLQLQQRMWQLPEPTQLIDDFAFTHHLATRVEALSAGNLKKLSLLLAFMRQPELLLLDEPTIALDEAAQQALWRYIDTYPGTIIAASHEAAVFRAHQFELVPLHAA